jgi:hypothetical protein
MNNPLKKLTVAFILLFICGCDQVSELTYLGPSEVLIGYLNATKEGRNEEAYRYISAEDKKFKSIEDYKSNASTVDNPLALIMKRKISYKILKSSNSEYGVKVLVELAVPDINVMIKDFMGTAFKPNLLDDDKAELQRSIAAKYENADIPTVIKKQEFHLRKEGSEWKVFLDWKSQKIANEKQAQISKLLSDAQKLRSSNKLDESIQKYEQLLALDGEIAEAKEGINAVRNQIEGEKLKQDYLKNLTLYELKSAYYKTYLEENVPGVSLKIKNNGNKTLKRIQVTVYFKNKDGIIVFEEKFHPVVERKYSLNENNGPLKPNYIWSMGVGRFYKSESVPSEWKEGSVSARVTDIEFAE